MVQRKVGGVRFQLHVFERGRITLSAAEGSICHKSTRSPDRNPLEVLHIRSGDRKHI